MPSLSLEHAEPGGGSFRYLERTLCMALVGTAALACGLIANGWANADEGPRGAPTGANPNETNAAALVRALYAREAWLDSSRLQQRMASSARSIILGLYFGPGTSPEFVTNT